MKVWMAEFAAFGGGPLVNLSYSISSPIAVMALHVMCPAPSVVEHVLSTSSVCQLEVTNAC